MRDEYKNALQGTECSNEAFHPISGSSDLQFLAKIQ